MKLSLRLLLCQSAILLVSFGGIVCSLFFDFIVDNFGVVDSYSRVEFDGNNKSGRFIFTKGGPRDSMTDNCRQEFVHIRDIVTKTLKQEQNCLKIVSFYVKGRSANYNIRFKSARQAQLFVTNKALPSLFKVLWARIYTNWRPVIIAYDPFDTGDIGFKLLDNEQFTNEYEHLSHVPYIFLRSDILNEMKIRSPQTLYMRNQIRFEDYEIKFRSKENLATFLEFFPNKIFDENKTVSYYFIPSTLPPGMSQSQDPLESHETSELQETSESHETLKSQDPLESHETSELHDTSKSHETSELHDTSESHETSKSQSTSESQSTSD